MPTSLVDLPEIGPWSSKRLEQVGIADAETLRKVGAREAFIRVRSQLDPGACINEYTALECAVRGVRSRDLPITDRDEIRAWFRGLS